MVVQSPTKTRSTAYIEAGRCGSNCTVLDVVTVPFAGPTMHAATCSRELDITRGLFSSSAVQVQDQADGEVSRGPEVSVYAVEPR